jgi:hypothetical protein
MCESCDITWYRAAGGDGVLSRLTCRSDGYQGLDGTRGRWAVCEYKGLEGLRTSVSFSVVVWVGRCVGRCGLGSQQLVLPRLQS